MPAEQVNLIIHSIKPATHTANYTEKHTRDKSNTEMHVETHPRFKACILIFKLLHLKSILFQCLLFQTDAKHKIQQELL